MDVPGLENVRGTLEEALIFPQRTGRTTDDLDLIPGQSGAEGLADLPDDQS